MTGAWLHRRVSETSDSLILKRVSRSFYLSLRLLPEPMRESAGLAYLLARTSDTLADSSNASARLRTDCLTVFAKAVAHGGVTPTWPVEVLSGTLNPDERHLLERTGALLTWLTQRPEAEAALIREVLAVIVSGQQLDLERFEQSTPERVVSLQSAAELEDYAWRVAGSVGEFWTQLGFLTLGSQFSRASESTLLQHGRRYGIGLQLVNILRDFPEDLKAGRCYLPVSDPQDHEQLLAAHRQWLSRAEEFLESGHAYAALLTPGRLRLASELPVLIADETLERVRVADWEQLAQRVKVPRWRVYALVFQALVGSFSRQAAG